MQKEIAKFGTIFVAKSMFFINDYSEKIERGDTFIFLSASTILAKEDIIIDKFITVRGKIVYAYLYSLTSLRPIKMPLVDTSIFRIENQKTTFELCKRHFYNLFTPL